MGVGGGGRPGSSGSSTTSSKTTGRPGDPNCGKQVGEAGRPGGRVLVQSLLLRDCVTSDRFPPLSGPHFSSLICAMNEGGLKSGFKLCLMKP